MKNKITIALLAVTGLFFASCEKDSEIVDGVINTKALENSNSQTSIENSGSTLTLDTLLLPAIDADFLNSADDITITHDLRDAFINEAVEPSECAPTEFAAVQSSYLKPLANDLYAVYGKSYATMFYLFLDLNFYYSYFDRSENQYFGVNGEYTDLVAQRKHNLEKFWNMPNEVRINGQHSAFLTDREKLADIYEIVGVNVETREDAYAIADYLIYFNSQSELISTTPYFSIDGYATPGNLIVIGDGIVQMLSETGIAEDIVWTGILSHEWAHQVQFDNDAQWYPEGAADNAPEATRYIELEADFFSAYYMTHKRGATYNWKRVEQFFDLFSQIGDCGFTKDGHHGTPQQRLRAAQLGYELANLGQKQGFILSEQELHTYFVSNVESLF